MKKLGIICLIILVLVLSISNYYLLRLKSKEYHESFILTVSNTRITTEKKISETNETYKYKINIYFPHTAYAGLNDAISNKIDEIVMTFRKIAEETNTGLEQYCELYITYETDTMGDYVTYIFHIMEDTKGAHPNTTIWTITFNQKSNEIITMDDLVKKNANLLQELAYESRNILLSNSRLDAKKDLNIHEMMLEGTAPIIENYRNFALSEESLIIFFERYKIAPYSYGEFQVSIPYSNISFTLE